MLNFLDADMMESSHRQIAVKTKKLRQQASENAVLSYFCNALISSDTNSAFVALRIIAENLEWARSLKMIEFKARHCWIKAILIYAGAMILASAYVQSLVPLTLS
jgi:hypothetical protein